MKSKNMKSKKKYDGTIINGSLRGLLNDEQITTLKNIIQESPNTIKNIKTWVDKIYTNTEWDFLPYNLNFYYIRPKNNNNSLRQAQGYDRIKSYELISSPRRSSPRRTSPRRSSPRRSSPRRSSPRRSSTRSLQSILHQIDDCPICLDKIIDTVYIPCGHGSCEEDATSIINNSRLSQRKCPICRVYVEGIQKIYITK